MLTSLQLLDSIVDVENYDNNFLILKSGDQSAIREIGKAIFQKDFNFVEEVIVTEVEVCLKLNPCFDPSDIELLASLKKVGNTKPQTYRLPIFFGDHKDWIMVESHTGFSKNEIIKELSTTEFSISMFGFLPGFLYLHGLDKKLHVPRKNMPSKYVKANSIAIGGPYLGVYSLDSPGGWHVIGMTPISVLQIPELPPLELNLEDKIIIESISEEEYKSLLQNQISLIEFNA